YPGLFSGSYHASTSSRVLGAEVNVRGNVWNNQCNRLDMLGGYRYFRLAESLTMSETIFDLTANNAQTDSNDFFKTGNNFNGGQWGLQWVTKQRRWTLDVLTKLAVGSNTQHVSIRGNTSFQGGTPVDGGFLALSSNSGIYERSR